MVAVPLTTLTAVPLTIVGSINVDAITRCERLPERGETVLATEAITALGGKGANQAVAAARAGARVSLIGCVGDDAAGRNALKLLTDEGVNVAGVRTVACATGTAYVTVSAIGENQIAVVAGANRELRPADAEAARGAAVLCQLEIPDDVVATAATVAGRFFLNASPVRRLPQTVYGRTELTIVNDTEMRVLGGQLNRGRVIVTQGPAGALLREDGQERLRVPAPSVPVVDTTGAGDAFAGTLVTAVLAGTPVERALADACADGAAVVGALGAQREGPA